MKIEEKLTPEIKRKLKIAREKRVTEESLKKRGLESRKSIEGYRKGYELGPEAWNHTYTV